MASASILWSGQAWLGPAAGAVVLGVLLVIWSYRAAAQQPFGLRLTCAGLKLLGLLALAACLLEPLWTQERAKPGANYLVLLADNSQSMQVKAAGETRSRGEYIRAALAAEKSKWQAQLLENFQLRRYLFDTRLQAASDFSELTFEGRASTLLTSLAAVADRFRGQPLAGIFLWSDGNATDQADALPDLAGLPPIYPVIERREDAVKDIAVAKVTVSQTVFEDAPVTVQAEVRGLGFNGTRVLAQLVEAGYATPVATRTNETAARTNPPAAGRVRATNDPARTLDTAERIVAEQTQRIPQNDEPLVFRFQVRPTHSGLTFYRLRVAERGEQDHLQNPKGSDEATLANNARTVVVDRGRGPYRILYAAGRPNWEYKFLSRAVAEDDQVQMVGLLRIARREPKFEFRGRGTANPFFTGMTNQDPESVERYDKPVLVRLNTRDQFELSGGFPRTPEELFEYHAIIIDDLEAEFFEADQMALISKFVSERGGGLLMLGGMESFSQGKYQRTAIGDLLPVYLDQLRQEQAPGELRFALTREGWLQPWARLRDNELAEKDRLGAMPPFQVLNRVRGLKPGASAVATVASSDGEAQPAIAVQQFGRGHVGAMMVGDLWRWGLREEALHRDLDKAWRQLVRWLVSDVPNRVEIVAEEKRGDPNHAVVLNIRVRDKKFQPLDNASATLQVRPAGQKSAASNAPPIRITAEPALTESGLYQATFVPRGTGGYFAEVTVRDEAGAEIGRAQSGWASDPAAEEFRSLTPNRALLETLAQKTGGQVVGADKLEEFARALPARKMPVTEAWTSPLWHQATVFLFALACFVAEWGLRRMKGMV